MNNDPVGFPFSHLDHFYYSLYRHQTHCFMESSIEIPVISHPSATASHAIASHVVLYEKHSLRSDVQVDRPAMTHTLSEPPRLVCR